MWKAQVGVQIDLKDNQDEDDDWETDPDFVNDVTEEEQRWGSATVIGSGRTAGAIDMNQLRKETEEADALKKKKEMDEGPNAAFGYGGKFGVQQDRMDQSAVGHDYLAKLEKHASQMDYSTGFGGKFGVQSDRVDKSAMSWDHKEKVEKHTSQKDYTSGFGGKFGVQTDRQDKSAVGWDHIERVEKHESQKDYSKGFGGKFGVQSDRQDKSAVGWDHHESPQKHESQLDHKKGFGGKFGVQTDRMDKSAVAFGDEPTRVGTTYTKTKPDIGSAKPSILRAKFEQQAKEDEQVPRPPVAVPVQKSGSSVQARAAAFNSPAKISNESIKTIPEVDRAPKQLDQSKMAFLSQTSQQESPSPTQKTTPRQLDHSKFSFAQPNTPTENSSSNQIREELEQLKLSQQQKQRQQQEVAPLQDEQVEDKIEDKLTQQMETNVTPSITNITKVSKEEQKLVKSEEQFDDEVAQFEAVEAQLIQEEEIADTGLTAIALYDYQAAADDEISFDPDDTITHVEKIDEGWWRGMCKGQYGLFPANYVQLQ